MADPGMSYPDRVEVLEVEDGSFGAIGAEEATASERLIDGRWGGDKGSGEDIAGRTRAARSRRCIGSPRCFGLAGTALLLAGLSVAFLMPRDGPDYEIELPQGVNRAAFPVPRDNRSSWMHYHKKLKARAENEGADVRVVLLGDSITEELLGTASGVARKGWGSPVVWAEYYEGLGSLNLGVSGDQTQHLLWRIQNGELPDAVQPESVLIAIGTNNLGNGMDASDTAGGVKAVVEYVREQRPDALVCVMALFPRADKMDRGSKKPWGLVDEVNVRLEHMLRLRYGVDNVPFINCNDRFLATDDEGQQILNSDLILDDNLHLTAAGLDAWADCASSVIQSGLTDPLETSGDSGDGD